MSIIEGITKGLMEAVEEIRPRDIISGGIKQLQAEYAEDKILDQNRLQNVLAESETLLNDASREVTKQAKRNSLYSRVADTYGDDVANYLGANKVYSLFDDDGRNQNAIFKDVNNYAMDARRQLLTMSPEDIQAITNPYGEDTTAKLYEKRDQILTNLKDLQNIPDKTGAVALRIKDVDRIFAPLTETPAVATGEAVRVPTVRPITTEQQRGQNIYADYVAMTSAGIDPMNADQARAAGFNPLSQRDIIAFGGGMENLQLMATLNSLFPSDPFLNQKGFSDIYNERIQAGDSTTDIINDFIIQLQTPTITYDEKLNFYKQKYKEDNRYKDLSDEDLEKEILSNSLLKEELDRLK